MKKGILAVSCLLLATLACNNLLGQSEPLSTPTQPANLTQATSNLPLSQDAVPRVAVQDAKAALDSGQAVIVDVRSPDAYAAGHIAGAISISLGEIESNPGGLALDKNEWIITYCT